MISKRLQKLFVLSIPFLVAHGLEEYFTSFYSIDPFAKFAFGPLRVMSNQQATFLLFQVLLWMFLVNSALMISSEEWRLRLMVLPGLIYLFELHHIVHTAIWGHYYPGTATSLALPIIGVFFWREWRKCWTERRR